VTVEHEWAAERHWSEPVAEAAVESRRAEAAVEPAEAAVEAAESAMMEPAHAEPAAERTGGRILRRHHETDREGRGRQTQELFMGTPP
jgi:hypothetical protein